MQCFRKELHKFREEKSDGRLLLTQAQELLVIGYQESVQEKYASFLDIWHRTLLEMGCQTRSVFSSDFFSKFLVTFLFATNYPSGTAMTQLQMFLYSPHRNHGDSGSCQHMKSALILELQYGHSSNQAGVWLTLGIAVTDFCRTWFKTMYLFKNFSEKRKKKELLLC